MRKSKRLAFFKRLASKTNGAQAACLRVNWREQVVRNSTRRLAARAPFCDVRHVDAAIEFAEKKDVKIPMVKFWAIMMRRTRHHDAESSIIPIMRTTLTIDDDIAMKLKSEAKRAKDKSFKEVVNETLRRGLLMNNEIGSSVKFQVKSRGMGFRQGLNYDNIGELLEQIEDSQK